MSANFNKTIEYISSKAAALLYMLDEIIKNKTTEIRLRVDKPLCITCEDKPYFISVDGKALSTVPKNPFLIDKTMLQECYMFICNNSVYAHEQELSNGYVTLQNGARVGIFGNAVFNNDKITAFKDITSLNYRIPREFIGCARPISDVLRVARGVIICGPPSSSKTTLLRDSVRMLASGECEYKRVSVIDARNEISALQNGKIGMNLGNTCDVINIPSTDRGIEMAIRVMNPQYIAVDEILSDSELNALIKAAKCGVKLIATMHVGDEQEILKKKSVQVLINNDAVDYAVFIKYPSASPIIIKLS